ncbi:MAG: hypothetical protein KGM91_03670 [Burkholderiales bacterium]|nr:hypothetical protein [Burkholderiales bacterium]
MKVRHTVAAAAVAAALLPPLQTRAESAAAASPSAASAAAAAASAAPTAPRQPEGWIVYDDMTYSPVVDDVSRQLAAARAALASKNNAAAAQALDHVATLLQAQGDKLAKIDRDRAVVDLEAARDARVRMAAARKQIERAASLVKAGKIASTAALDKTFGAAYRSDLDRRWIVSEVTTRIPLYEAPQRHFEAAMADYARHDYHAAATEVRKASAYVRLEAARASGDVRGGLDASDKELDALANSLDKGSVEGVGKGEQDVRATFARAEYALALAHRAKAVESWSRKSFDEGGHELEGSAGALDHAADWAGQKADAAAGTAASDARDLGHKVVAGSVWSRDEASKTFEGLGHALDRLGQDLHLKAGH